MKNIRKIVLELSKARKLNTKKLRSLQTRYPKDGDKLYSKSEILEEYKRTANSRQLTVHRELLEFLKTKPTRTVSGVTPVTVLTKPYKCPGNCVFCPTEQEQPKSYLSSEPGAMRARMLKFDPFTQVKVRIQALENIGHSTDKVELIILGGTWSSYPRKYQAWFIKECFRAMNYINSKGFKSGAIEPATSSKHDFNKANIADITKELVTEQVINETAKHRCVGLVVETRPDSINEEHLQWLRFLGATKVQVGVQSLDDKLLKLNKRGHSVQDTKKAIRLLRLAGFKLHLHWMLNLYGSNPENDFADFKKLFEDESYRPDELKIYPCMLLENTELFKLYKERRFKPYSKIELVDLLIKFKQIVPEYCRITRLFRDIPSFEVVEGVKETNLRQIVQEEMKKRNLKCRCIRCREIKNLKFKIKNSKLKILKYKTSVGEEHFLSYVDSDGKLLGFLRLFLPNDTRHNFIHEIQDSAIIREVHVYGVAKQLTAKQLSSKSEGVQHRGIGKKLIENAENIAMKNGFRKMTVISAIGTREYYRKRGYHLGDLYMSKKLT